MTGLIIAGISLLGGSALLGLRKSKARTATDREIEEKAKLYTPESYAQKTGRSIEQVRKSLAERYPHSKAGTPLRIASNSRTNNYRGPQGRDNPGAKIRLSLTDGEQLIYHLEIGEYLGVSTGKIYLNNNIAFLQVKDFQNDTAYVAIDNIEEDPRGVQADNRSWYEKAKDWAASFFSGLGNTPAMGRYAFVIEADDFPYGDPAADVVITFDWGTSCLGNYATVRTHALLATRNASSRASYTANVIQFFDSWLRRADWGFAQGNPDTGLVELWFDLKNVRDFAGVDVCQRGITVCQHAADASLRPLRITPLETVCSACEDPAQIPLGTLDSSTAWIETIRITPAFDVTTNALLRDASGKIRSFPKGRIVGQSVERKAGLQVVRSAEDDRLLIFPLESIRAVVPDRKSLIA